MIKGPYHIRALASAGAGFTTVGILVVNNGDQHQDDHKKHQGEDWGQRGQSSPAGLLRKFSLRKFHVHTLTDWSRDLNALRCNLPPLLLPVCQKTVAA